MGYAKFLKTFVVAAIATAGAFAAAGAASATTRVALVIGNGDYVHQSKLANPANDIARMTDTLNAIGYDVTTLSDLDEDAMERALADFSDKADKAEVAVVYYSGHGMEIQDTNYLIPIDAELKKERDAKFEAVDLDYVRAAIEGASQLKVVILDACRNNTFLAKTRGGTKGLKRVVAQAGEIIAYSTAPGSVAQDGEPGGLSPYTRALSEKLEESPDLDVRFLFTSLGAKTAEYAGVQQRPYTEFASILPDGRLPMGASRAAPEDAAFDRAIATKDIEALKQMVQDFPNHPRAAAAMAAIRDAESAAADQIVAEALRSLDRDDLRRAAVAGVSHERADEVRAAIEVHRKIDDAIAGLDITALDALYEVTDERHPRRSDLRDALRRAIVSDSCAKMLKYRMFCPSELMAMANGPVAAPVATPAPAPAPEPTPVVQAPPPAPVDPLDEFTDDVDGAALGKAAAVKTEWRQVALRALGHYDGAIDGQAGPAMSRAIDDWRAALGLDGSGDLAPREVVALMKQGAAVDMKARAYLGVMYGIGLGVGLDPQKATEHLEAANSAGERDAGVYLKNLSANWK